MVRAHNKQFFDEDFYWGNGLNSNDLANADASDAASPATMDSWEFYGDGASLPWPSNLPTNEEPAQPRTPLVYYPTMQRSQYGTDHFSQSPQAPSHGEPIYVILFGVGQESTEGIYTLRTQDLIDGSVINVDTVVAFECADDAERFSTLLEASLSHVPTVFPMTWSEITEWCNENNTRCRLETSGSLLLPPDSNVNVTDWERTLRLQRGEFRVLDLEPSSSATTMLDVGLADGFFIDGPSWVYEQNSSKHEIDETCELEELHMAVDSQVAAFGWSAIRENLEKQMR